MRMKNTTRTGMSFAFSPLFFRKTVHKTTYAAMTTAEIAMGTMKLFVHCAMVMLRLFSIVFFFDPPFFLFV